MITNDNRKRSKLFNCESCDYTTCKKSQYDRHLSTGKHQLVLNDNQKVPKRSQTCKCGKIYKYISGLSRHQKTCRYKESTQDVNVISSIMQEHSDLKNMVVEILKSNGELQKQNSELQKHVIELCKVGTNNNYTNSHNKTFNLNFFLNEQCKDAMNITDFADSVTLSLKDLEKVGSSGYIEGISSIIIKELKSLDVYKRPVHCSDAKRETLYIKDEDKWEKECSENKKIKKVIKNVEHKNIKMISKWTEEHPKFFKSTDIDNDQYLHIVQESMGGPGNLEEKENKIVKKIAKEMIIDK